MTKENFLVNDKAVEFDMFVLALMGAKRVKNRHEVDYLIKMIRDGLTYVYTFQNDKVLKFTIKEQ